MLLQHSIEETKELLNSWHPAIAIRNGYKIRNDYLEIAGVAGNVPILNRHYNESRSDRDRADESPCYQGHAINFGTLYKD
jgi:hypothetical protein